MSLPDELRKRSEYLAADRIEELEEALAGLRDLCEQAGMPCDRANELLPKNPDDYEGEDEFFRSQADTATEGKP